MSDRVSQMPPTDYLGDEEMRDRYEREEIARGRRMAQPRKFKQHSNSDVSGAPADRSDNTRHSGIFRFGKSLAASFNPSNWKIWSKQQQEEEETESQRILRERQEKAQKIYQDLKKSGHFRDSAVPPKFAMQEDKKPAPINHDSGVASRANGEMTRDEKRMGRTILEPPQFGNHGGSPTSNIAESVVASNASARKNTIQFRRPSFSSIRKAAGSESGSNAPSSGDFQQARRIPSRKDLQKQQKLVKRVSDLEGKLEAARRQLSQALGEPIPPRVQPPERIGRPRFVPGALSTLPSERLLSGYVSSDVETGISDNDVFSQIGRAVTTDNAMESDAVMPEGIADSCADSCEVEDTPAPPPSREEKLLPKSSSPASQDRMEGVERESGFYLQPASKTKLHQTDTTERHSAEPDESSVSSDVKTESEFDPTEVTEAASESEFVEEDEEDDYTPVETAEPESESDFEVKRKHTKDPKKKPSPRSTSRGTKKKKKTFERDIDTSGRYRPPPESEPSTILPESRKARTTTKQTPSARPRKLQKTTHDEAPTHKPSLRKGRPSTQPGKVTSPQDQLLSARHRARPKKETPSTKPSVPLSSIKLSKSRSIPQKAQQSVSPPPSSSFTGLAYPKPGSKIETEPMYTAIPSAEGEVPPMPKLPKAVRLPSGEVVSTTLPQGSHGSGSGLGKLTKSSPKAAAAKRKKEDQEKEGGTTTTTTAGEQRKDGAMIREDSFEWDKDVF